MNFSHLDKNGDAVMVDVGEKNITVRQARAAATVKMKEETLKAILGAGTIKGDVLSVSRLAGIMAGKKTSDIIPLCHNIVAISVEITFENNGKDELYIYCIGKCSYKTGIEMEALTAVSAAALTVYDMCKAVDRGMVIKEIRLVEKTGGKSDYKNEG